MFTDSLFGIGKVEVSIPPPFVLNNLGISAGVCKVANLFNFKLNLKLLQHRNRFFFCVYDKLKRSSIILETFSSVGVQSYIKSVEIKYLKALNPDPLS